VNRPENVADMAARFERIRLEHAVVALSDHGIQHCACGAQLGTRTEAPAQHVEEKIAEYVLGRSEGEETQVYVQWKGTDVCLDFNCECGTGSHFDGYFLYALQCPGCGRKYDMPAHPSLLPFSGQFEPKVLVEG
jgi:hypothetical protein